MDAEEIKRQIEILVKKRGIQKGRLTKHKTYIAADHENINLHDIEKRIEYVADIIKQYDAIFEELAEISDYDENHTNDYTDFEDDSLQVLGQYQAMLDEITKPATAQPVALEPNLSIRDIRTISARPVDPKIKPFTGIIEEWNTFKEIYIAYIHDKQFLSNIEKFIHLKSYIQGEAQNVIKNVAFTEQGYVHAWQALCDRFDNKQRLATRHVEALLSISKGGKITNAAELQTIVDSCNNEILSLNAIGIPTDNWDLMVIGIISPRLDTETREQWETLSMKNEFSTWREMREFLNTRCRVLEAVGSKTQKICSQQQASFSKLKSKFSDTKSSKSFLASKTSQQLPSQCLICNGTNHYTSVCPSYSILSDKEKLDKVKTLNLCLNCLRKGHSYNQCRSSRCKICQKPHNTTLHEAFKVTSTHNSNSIPIPESVKNDICTSTSTTSSSNSFHVSSNSTILLSTAKVKIADAHGIHHDCRILLDSGSHANFISNDLALKLGLKMKQHHLKVAGLDTITIKIKQKITTTILSRIGCYKQNMEFLVVPKITDCLPSHHIPMKNITIPKDVELADPSFNCPLPIDALIGAQHFFDIIKQQRLHISEYLPPLQATEFGYIITGEVPTVNYNFGLLLQHDPDDELNNIVSKFWSLEHVSAINKLSEEEKQCQNHFSTTHSRDENGRYIVHLPFRNNVNELGESKIIATNRFLAMERKLERDDYLKGEYHKFMQQYEALGHMHKIDNTQIHGNYLPHHSVIKPSSSTTKVRVVFDASCKTSTSLSLNDVLLDGPKVQDDLFNIILRFRLPTYVFSGDIEKMYRQIQVIPKHRCYQRILFRYSPEKPIETYELATVTYGTKSAAYLATAALNQLAHDEGENYPLAKEAMKNFYVDDVMTGDNNLTRLIQIKNQLCEMLLKGGMKLRKFVSNSQELLCTIPIEDQEIQQDVDDLKPNDVISTLGLKWDPVNDKLMFITQDFHNSHPTTKRGVLSCVAKIYDPLGVLAPVITTAKIYLQHLWIQQIQWDDQLPASMIEKFKDFLTDFSSIGMLQINRHVTNQNYNTIELHGFSDASEVAYGACIYLLTTDIENNTSMHLLCAKSRVAPLKHHTIPRLELCAALLLARLFSTLQTTIQIKFDRICLWSDSTITLAWIKTPSYQLKEFIASRVAEIQELTAGITWYHVKSQDNPADVISRGCSMNDLAYNINWWNGPEFLRSSTLMQYSKHVPDLSNVEILERKDSRAVFSNQIQNDVIHDLIHRLSSYSKLIRITKYVVRFINKLITTRINKSPGKFKIREFDEKLTAMNILVISIQKDAFYEDRKSLLSNKEIPNSSKLKALTPFMDENNIIRVGGRISKSNLPYDQCHQMLIPHNHHFTEILFNHFHIINLHCGAQTLLYQTRKIFWTIKGKLTAKRIISKCVACSKQKPTPCQQLMGSLPADRVKMQQRAFSVVGVDYCGPFLTRIPNTRMKTTFKAYIGVFVCFATKAIHLEVISDLTTEGFLAALHRFTARRGKPSAIHSDNGTNFVGTHNYLEALSEFFKNNDLKSAIDSFCEEQNIQWHFIPPRSPHHGGLWEAGVKAVKHHLRRITNEHPLSFEELTTLAARIEGCLNSRPISILSDDPHDMQPLTPSHFLIGTPYTPIQEPDLTARNICHLSRWNQITHMVQSFWKRWSLEYIQSLQKRSKWKNLKANLEIGDVILIHPEQNPPAKWILGRITDIHQGTDGLVRVVSAKTKSGIIKRAISKISPLLKE